MARLKGWLKVWFPDEVEKLKHEENGLILDILENIDEILFFNLRGDWRGLENGLSNVENSQSPLTPHNKL